MKRFIFGFHRRVWCPKWTPLCKSWRIVTTAMPTPPSFLGCPVVGRAAATPGACGTPDHAGRET
jgi:hypothetical protein